MKKFILTVCCLFLMAASSFAQQSGNVTETMSWTLTTDGTLTISTSLSGEWMPNNNSPWLDYASEIKTIVINKGILSVGSSAFSNCTNLISVSLPEGITTINSYAFSGCTSLVSISLPASLTTIWDAIFTGCSKLTSINVSTESTSFKSVDGVLFDKNMKSILTYPAGKPESSYTIPNGVACIEKFAFNGSSSLTTVTIPGSVEKICWQAFAGCSLLNSIVIPEGVKIIETWVFYNCTALSDISIPSSMTSIGENAFLNCKSLTSIVVAAENMYYKSDDGVLFDKNMTTLIIYPRGKQGEEYTIPQSVEHIAKNAFNKASIASISIPEGVISIDEHAFYGCDQLEVISLPESVLRVGDDAFYDTRWYWNQPDGPVYLNGVLLSYKGTMSDNASINVAAGTRVIAASALDNSHTLVSVSLPEGLVSIGRSAFAYSALLEEINIPASVTRIEEWAFDGTAWYENQPDGVLYINKVLYKYKGKMPSATTIDVTAGTVAISGNAFYDCSSLTSITFPESLENIGKSAFWRCNSLTSIVFPEGLVSIENSAFDNCGSLSSVTFSSSITSIGAYAFSIRKLTKMIVKAEIPPFINYYTFYLVNRTIPVYVPDESLAAYQAHPLWKEFNLRPISSASVKENATDNISVYTEGGNIIITGIENPQVMVVDMTGKITASGRMNVVALPHGNIYVVHVAGRSFKIKN